MGSLLFAKGDLVHVPQSAILYGSNTNGMCIWVNKKPSLAIFINYKQDGMAEVVMDGKKWLVKDKEIYLNKEPA